MTQKNTGPESRFGAGDDQPSKPIATELSAHPDILIAEALAIRELGADVIDATDIGTYAILYAVRNWPVFPLRGKVPAIPNPHPKGSRERQTCKGECGKQGHGVLDATADITTVANWWAGRYVGANIGGRVPESMIVLDTDPYNGGLESLGALEARFGKLPKTLTDLSGRGDGGAHYFYRRPPGKLSATRLGPGIDIKSSTGYVVLPPSVHPDTGKPYTRVDHPVATPPAWLVELLLPEPVTIVAPRKQRSRARFYGPSIADEYCANTSWSDILAPHGWRCRDADPDADGARWLHPTHTSACSATVKNGCLFVYSPNTVFDITEPSYPKGYTKFRAYALLNHDGDMSAAALSLKGVA
jgi:Bifunctional DNA primase/polymerase, N-terminal